MGQKIVLSETFSGSGLPVLYPDTLMSSGSLILHDVGHSLGGFSGVPANTGVIPNIAWQTANSLVSGSPGQSALSGVMSSTDTIGSVSYPFAERTPKLGLHIIRSQANDLAGRTYGIQSAASILAYMKANPDHQYYISFWHKVTRAFTTSGSPFPFLSCCAQNTGAMIYNIGAGAVNPAGTNLGANYSNTNPGLTLGNGLVQVGVAGHSGSVTNYLFWLYSWGGAGGGDNLHVGGSMVFYRGYCEDLTVSGRTYAQVAAIDLALFNTAFASGGKFNGDTNTAPSGYP